MLTVSELKALLSAQGIRLTKRLGQHHLVDERIIQRLMDRCAFSADETVVEIGSGLGALTEPLAKRVKQVIAVEVDPRISRLLAERLAWAGNVRVLCQDILAFSWEGFRGVTVVGAIPYHITSPILASLSQARRAIRRAILIVQEEVADRLAASPGTKAYGRLSVLAQYGWRISDILRVSRAAFFPRPDVDSRCLELKGSPRPAVAVADEPLFFNVVKAAFAQRRKTLVNCLAAAETLAIPRARAEALLRASGLPASIRGEALSLAQFATLANALARTPEKGHVEKGHVDISP